MPCQDALPCACETVLESNLCVTLPTTFPTQIPRKVLTVSRMVDAAKEAPRFPRPAVPEEYGVMCQATGLESERLRHVPVFHRPLWYAYQHPAGARGAVLAGRPQPAAIPKCWL